MIRPLCTRLFSLPLSLSLSLSLSLCPSLSLSLARSLSLSLSLSPTQGQSPGTSDVCYHPMFHPKLLLLGAHRAMSGEYDFPSRALHPKHPNVQRPEQHPPNHISPLLSQLRGCHHEVAPDPWTCTWPEESSSLPWKSEPPCAVVVGTWSSS